MFNDELIAVSSSFGKYKNLFDISLRELSNLPISVLSRDYAIRKTIDEYFYDELLSPNYQFELNNYQSCLTTIKNTETITLLPKTFLRYENLENLNLIKIKDELEPLKVFGMHLKRNKFNYCLNYLLKIIEKKDV
jgi:DNA-binding transcriptional LysR family regulator